MKSNLPILLTCCFGLSCFAAGNTRNPFPIKANDISYPILPLQILYVATNGNDETAQINDPASPWATASNAVANAPAFSTVQFLYGSFADFTNLVPATGVTLAGMGAGNTILLSQLNTNSPSSGSAIEFPSAIYITNSGVALRNFTLQFAGQSWLSNSSTIMLPICIDADPNYSLTGNVENVTIDGVTVFGNTDCIYHGSGTMQLIVRNSYLNSYWDCFNGPGLNYSSGADVTFFNVNALTLLNTGVTANARCIVAGGRSLTGRAYRLRIIGGSFVMVDCYTNRAPITAAQGAVFDITGSYLANTSNDVQGLLINVGASAEGVPGGVVRFDQFETIYGSQVGLVGDNVGGQGYIGNSLDTTNASFAGAFLTASDSFDTRKYTLNGHSLTNLVPAFLGRNRASLMSCNVTTSPYLFTNTFGTNLVIYLYQGTNTGIGINGTFIGAMSNTLLQVQLQPGEWLADTNSGGRPLFNFKPL